MAKKELKYINVSEKTEVRSLAELVKQAYQFNHQFGDVEFTFDIDFDRHEPTKGFYGIFGEPDKRGVYYCKDYATIKDMSTIASGGDYYRVTVKCPIANQEENLRSLLSAMGLVLAWDLDPVFSHEFAIVSPRDRNNRIRVRAFKSTGYHSDLGMFIENCNKEELLIFLKGLALDAPELRDFGFKAYRSRNRKEEIDNFSRTLVQLTVMTQGKKSDLLKVLWRDNHWKEVFNETINEIFEIKEDK